MKAAEKDMELRGAEKRGPDGITWPLDPATIEGNLDGDFNFHFPSQYIPLFHLTQFMFDVSLLVTIRDLRNSVSSPSIFRKQTNKQT